MLPQGSSKAIVTRRSAECLDMGVFVESSDSLRRELTAEPVGFLDQTYAASAPRSSQGRRNATGPAADNEHIARHVSGATGLGDGNQGRSRLADRWHLHDVDEGFQTCFHSSEGNPSSNLP